MRKIIFLMEVSCQSGLIDDDDSVPNWVYVELTEELIRRILVLRMVVLTSGAYCVKDWNYNGMWGHSETLADGVDEEWGGDPEACRHLLEGVALGKCSMDCTQLAVKSDGFYFSGIPKHGDSSHLCTSETLLFEEFETITSDFQEVSGSYTVCLLTEGAELIGPVDIKEDE